MRARERGNSPKVALVGLHEWTEDDFPNVAEWGHPVLHGQAIAEVIG
jgi:hypothetical protein